MATKTTPLAMTPLGHRAVDRGEIVLSRRYVLASFNQA